MNRRLMYVGTLTSSILALVGSGAAQAEEYGEDSSSKWEVAIGAGAMYAPKYEGSDEMEIQAMPFLHVEWDNRIFLNPGDGLGVRVYRGDDLEISASVGYDMGRDESDSSDLRGLGDVDGAATINLSAEYELGPVTPFVSLSRHIGGTDGLLVEAGLETFIPLSRQPTEMDYDGGDGPTGPAMTFGVSSEWADDNYMGDYFGVTAVQSARSGLARYDAGAGFKSIGAELGFMYPLDESWSLNASAEYQLLLGDAADSPIVKDENQFSAGSFIMYRF